MRLEGHTAFVTGGGGALGTAMAQRLSAEGAAVVVTDIAEERAESTATLLRDAGGRASAVAHDVTKRDSWQAALDAAEKEFGHVDIVINNAGVVRDRTVAKMSEDEWDTVIAIHLRGAFLGSQLGLLRMTRGWGRIINLSAPGGGFGQANYSAAKHGIRGLTRSLARESARQGVLANCVAPGGIDTPMLRTMPPERFAAAEQQIPLKRFGTPQEVASVVAFLASDDASYINGQTISVDGGVSA
nr:SDR family NAD(P)-dependent oxidoreductase [Rhodococcus sp. (in: high G+C Gram-positive bacteria)]